MERKSVFQEAVEILGKTLSQSAAFPLVTASGVCADLREALVANGRMHRERTRFHTAFHESGHALIAALLNAESEPLTTVSAMHPSRTSFAMNALLSSLPIFSRFADRRRLSSGYVRYGCFGRRAPNPSDVLCHLAGLAADSRRNPDQVYDNVFDAFCATANTTTFWNSDVAVPFLYVQYRMHFLGLDDETIPMNPTKENVTAVCMMLFKKLQRLFMGKADFVDGLNRLRSHVYRKKHMQGEDLRSEIFEVLTGDKGLKAPDDHPKIRGMKTLLSQIDIDEEIREYFRKNPAP